MKTAAAFKQTDITRALRGARSAGAVVSEVNISPKGAIQLVLKDPANPTHKGVNNWDDVLE